MEPYKPTVAISTLTPEVMTPHQDPVFPHHGELRHACTERVRSQPAGSLRGRAGEAARPPQDFELCKGKKEESN